MKKPNAVPRCFICKKPVEAFAKMKTGASRMVEFKAWCHGQVDVIRVPFELVQYSDSIEFGDAFMPGLIEPAKEPAPLLENPTKWFLA